MMKLTEARGEKWITDMSQKKLKDLLVLLKGQAVNSLQIPISVSFDTPIPA